MAQIEIKIVLTDTGREPPTMSYGDEIGKVTLDVPSGLSQTTLAGWASGVLAHASQGVGIAILHDARASIDDKNLGRAEKLVGFLTTLREQRDRLDATAEQTPGPEELIAAAPDAYSHPVDAAAADDEGVPAF